MAGRLAERRPAAALRALDQRTAAPLDVGLATSYDRGGLTPAPATRSRCAPATTSTAAHGRRTRRSPRGVHPTSRVHRTRPPATVRSRRRGPRRRPTAARSITTRSSTTAAATRTSAARSTSWNATNGTGLPGARAGLQRRRLLAVERLEPVGHATGTATAGQRHRQLLTATPRASRLQQFALPCTCRSRPRACNRTRPTPSPCNYPSNQGWSAHQRPPRTVAGRTRSTAPPATSARPSSSGRWSAAPLEHAARPPPAARCGSDPPLPTSPTPDCTDPPPDKARHHEHHRPTCRLVQPRVQPRARQRRAGHPRQDRPDRARRSCACSPRATCCSRTCPAPARRRWPRPSPTRSRARGGASSSRPTCCRPTSPAGSIYDQSHGTFDFRPGPVFANVVLADEINRASPKTQSALLEVMEERQVTVDGVGTHVPRPFVVIATQNPIEQEGTYRAARGPARPLPAAHRRSATPTTTHEVEPCCACDRGRRRRGSRRRSCRCDEAQTMIAIARSAHVDDTIHDYVVRIVRRDTRRSTSSASASSTRGALALIRAARALAVAQGRPFVTVDDIKVARTRRDGPPPAAHAGRRTARRAHASTSSRTSSTASNRRLRPPPEVST